MLVPFSFTVITMFEKAGQLGLEKAGESIQKGLEKGLGTVGQGLFQGLGTVGLGIVIAALIFKDKVSAKDVVLLGVVVSGLSFKDELSAKDVVLLGILLVLVLWYREIVAAASSVLSAHQERTTSSADQSTH